MARNLRANPKSQRTALNDLRVSASIYDQASDIEAQIAKFAIYPDG
jgi:hypothetical protein